VFSISELASNVVGHARTDYAVTGDVKGAVVRIEVSDGSATDIALREARSDETTGRGSLLVARLSSRWGVGRYSDGESVWFELECRPSVPRRNIEH
jgi:hypothetical protein